MSEPTTATEPTTTEPTTTTATTTATEPTTTATTTEPTTTTSPTETVDFWKSQARKQEDRAKENATKAKEYDKLVEASQTETQRAQAAATAAESRAQALVESVAKAEIKAALTGVVPDPAAVVDDLNVSKFLTDSGEVDADALKALRGRYEAFAPTGNGPRTPEPTPGQGANTQPAAGQLTRESLQAMTPAQIVEAQSKGLLNDVLGVK